MEWSIQSFFTTKYVIAGSVKQIFVPVPSVLVPINKFHYSIPLLIVIVKLSFIRVSCCIFVKSFPMLQPASELSLVEITIYELISAIAILLSIFPLAWICRAILVTIKTLPMRAIKRPLSLVFICCHFTMQECCIIPCTFSYQLHSAIIRTFSVWLIALPLSDISISISIWYFSLPLFYIINPFSFINVTI